MVKYNPANRPTSRAIDRAYKTQEADRQQKFLPQINERLTATNNAATAAAARVQDLDPSSAEYGQAVADYEGASRMNTAFGNTRAGIISNPATGANYLGGLGQNAANPGGNNRLMSLADLQKPTLDPKGNIQKNAVARMQKDGLSDSEILSRLNDPNYNKRISASFSGTGLGQSYDPTTGLAVKSGVEIRRAARLNEYDAKKEAINAKYDQETEDEKRAGGDGYQSAYKRAAELASLEKKNADEAAKFMEAEQASTDQEAKNADDNAAATKLTEDENEKARKTTEDTAFLDTALAGLPPDKAALLKGSLSQYLTATNNQAEGLDEVRDNEKDDAFDSEERWKKLFDKMDSTNKSIKGSLESFLNKSQTRQEEQLAREKELTTNQLQFQQDDLTRQTRKKLDKQLHTMAASQALSGGFGSSNANKDLSQAEFDGEQAIISLQKEFGFKKADVSIAYTSSLNGIYDRFGQAHITAIENYKKEVDRINTFRFSQGEATDQRNAKADADYSSGIAQIKTDQAKAITETTKMIWDAISDERKQKIIDDRADLRMTQQERLQDKRLSFQEEQNNKRFESQLSSQERQQMNTDKRFEQSSADDIRSEKNKIMSQPDVLNYIELRSVSDKMRALLQDSLGSKDLNKIGAMKVLVLTLSAKGSDPTTGVRDGELDKFGRAQGWKDKVMAVGTAIEGGDMTGISVEQMNAYTDAMGLMAQKQRVTAMAQMSSVINSIITHNNRSQYYPMNPSDVLSPEFLQDATEALNTYNAAAERIGQGYNLNWGDDPDPEGGGETDFGDALSSLGRFTQDFNTPIASREDGGLYDSSTVKAWGGTHAGVDIAVPQGTRFKSLLEGEVIEAGEEKGWGGTIVIRDAKGAEHRISHLSELNPNIKPGTVISQGQIIAMTGGAKRQKGSGNSTGAHIDYRIRYNGKYIDPLTYNPHV